MRFAEKPKLKIGYVVSDDIRLTFCWALCDMHGEVSVLNVGVVLYKIHECMYPDKAVYQIHMKIKL